MMRGVSTVVATVILIAITVVLAVAVWFWVGAMGKPATPPQEIRAFTIEKCIINATANATEIRLYNNGAVSIGTRTDARVIDANMGDMAGNVTFPGLKPGQRATIYLNTTLTRGSNYYVEYRAIPLQPFTC